MKVQLKLRNKIYENYLIDENGIIYDINGSIQETYIHGGRPYFKGSRIHSLIMHSFVGYKKNMVIHHINGIKNDNSLSNLMYLTNSEHVRLHTKGKRYHLGHKHSEEAKQKISEAIKGKKHSEEAKQKMSQSHIGNTNVRGRIWVNDGVLTKRVYPDQIPEGFVEGRGIFW